MNDVKSEEHETEKRNEAVCSKRNVQYDSLLLPDKYSCFKPGDLDQISSEYESLDYDENLNLLWLDERRLESYNKLKWKDLVRWIVSLVIGILTALVACTIDIAIVKLTSYKFSWLQFQTDRCVKENCLYLPYLMWLGLNVVFSSIAAFFGSYVEPVSAGSGIPQVKCYLNGIKFPRIIRIKTLICKCLGVICSVVGGLAVGKEGPMIHSGAVIAAGISQGKTTTFNFDFRILKSFREDSEKRDFVSAGAAAGVAAAFGAPVGGVLFSLEEGASFWNQALTWRVFFTALVSGFTLNVVLSSFQGKFGDLNNPGLLNFGKFNDLTYELIEFLPFIFIGVIGGILGAIFNYVNYKISVLRLKYINKPHYKIAEVVFVALVSASVSFLMIYAIDDCRDIDTQRNDTQLEGFPVKMFCKEGQESTAARLLLITPEDGVRSLFHDPKNAYGWKIISVFFVIYFLLSCSTYGLGIPSGLFIPTLLTGAAWGRIVGMLLNLWFPNRVDEGKYALVGAAAMLGGVVRMTISLTVILTECVGNITFGLPLMIVVMISKWVGDWFNEGIYDMHIQLSGAPFMPWEAAKMTNSIFVSEVMSKPVVTLHVRESVDNIVRILRTTPHNGFPVVDEQAGSSDYNYARAFGKLRGIILRTQLAVILKHKIFNENSTVWLENKVNCQMFRDEYPRYPRIENIALTSNDLASSIDLRPYMNISPYTITASAPYQRAFRLFRALGLRHIIAVNDEHSVVGIITRKDLVKYKLIHPKTGVRLKLLDIYKSRD